ncbi:Bromodomain-containing protein 8 [Merluccius polli]|uniref:Bromodomain-containing protein 8 n=1 Tax=Merluccius polli TaxID=89951 RepID=A0AA47MBU1_MERPO|nr:Bromodomain-containing protein 8 [Merluccius polli]
MAGVEPRAMKTRVGMKGFSDEAMGVTRGSSLASQLEVAHGVSLRGGRREEVRREEGGREGEHKMLAVAPSREPWSLREKLCLATSVMKSGDQNWVSVSRAIKPFAEPGRPPDWFSQKHCASQYSELLESTEAPKRKRGERGEAVETVEDVIVRRLTAERIDELKKQIRETQETHRKLKREAQLIQAGHLDCRMDEVWGEIVQKRRQTEEAAEVKRKTTDSAYQARQMAKTAVKRVASTAGLCPPEGSSPGLEPLPQPGAPPPAWSPSPSHDGASRGPRTSEGQPTPTRSVLVPAVFTPMTAYESSLPSNGDLVCQAVLLEDSLQRQKPLGQRTTPPPSPLLSELLKKGSILPANPRLIGEGEASGHVTGSYDLQLVLPPPPGAQTTGAPTLSRLLECAPGHFSALPSFMPAPDSVSMATHPADDPLPVDPPVLTSAGGLVAPAPYGFQREFGGPMACEGLGDEEEEVGGSYMGDELDLKTVGDIIAIIEDKMVENTEALDAAAVEAALSLCEESGHALAGGCWGAGPFKPRDAAPGSGGSGAADLPSPRRRGPTGARTDAPGVQRDRRLLPTYPGGGLLPPPPPPPPSSSSSASCPEPERRLRTGSPPPRPGTTSSTSDVSVAGKRESGDDPRGDSVLEDSPLTERHRKEKRKEEEEKRRRKEVMTKGREERGTSERNITARREEVEEEEREREREREREGKGGGGFLSEGEGEAEGEPPASGSEDGSSMHTAYSTPSSPVSSQFSVCSEDQEAIQAQKIWKKAIMLVWRAAANHRYANVFLQPVTDDIAPGYHGIVHRPMDLSTIKRNIEAGAVRSTAEFQRDVMLMFHNAVMYNSLDHDVFLMALEMQRDVLEHVQQFLATQLIMQTAAEAAAAGGGTKRGGGGGVGGAGGGRSQEGTQQARRQEAAAAAADKDCVTMASPAFLLSLFVTKRLSLSQLSRRMDSAFCLSRSSRYSWPRLAREPPAEEDVEELLGADVRLEVPVEATVAAVAGVGRLRPGAGARVGLLLAVLVVLLPLLRNSLALILGVTLLLISAHTSTSSSSSSSSTPTPKVLVPPARGRRNLVCLRRSGEAVPQDGIN